VAKDNDRRVREFFVPRHDGENTEIDPYAAESPAEFFAVLSEVFLPNRRCCGWNTERVPTVYSILSPGSGQSGPNCSWKNEGDSAEAMGGRRGGGLQMSRSAICLPPSADSGPARLLNTKGEGKP